MRIRRVVEVTEDYRIPLSHINTKLKLYVFQLWN